MAGLEEILAKLEKIAARRRATNICAESASADPTKVTANDGSAVTEEVANGNGERRAEQPSVEEVLATEPPAREEPPIATGKKQQPPPTRVSKTAITSVEKEESCKRKAESELVMEKKIHIRAREPETSISEAMVKGDQVNRKSRRQRSSGAASVTVPLPPNWRFSKNKPVTTVEEDRLRTGMRARINDELSGSVGRRTIHGRAADDDPRGDPAEHACLGSGITFTTPSGVGFVAMEGGEEDVAEEREREASSGILDGVSIMGCSTWGVVGQIGDERRLYWPPRKELLEAKAKNRAMKAPPIQRKRGRRWWRRSTRRRRRRKHAGRPAGLCHR
ncbi:unnamed protein product [Linum trigynum]